jgi:hypothetical protein
MTWNELTCVESADASAPANSRDVLIQRAARPREIRTNGVAMSYALIALAVFAGIAYAIARGLFEKWTTLKSAGDFWAAGWPGMLALLVFVAVMAAGVWSVFRDRELSKNGEVAIASVTSQEMHARSGSWITYSFRDAHGFEYRGACHDQTGRLLPGMTFAMFYEPELPRNRLASCDSHFTIVLPHEAAFSGKFSF